MGLDSIYFPEPVLKFLGKKAFKVFDFWLVIHFITGMVIGLILNIFDITKNEKLIIGFIILVLYEIFEFALTFKGLATTEPFLNIVLDILIGMIGIYLIVNIS